MSSKTTTNNTTRKDWKAKVDATLHRLRLMDNLYWIKIIKEELELNS